jgi:hypothetical protein
MTAPTTRVESPNGTAVRAYVLSELRCAALRARLAVVDIDTIGIALNARMIEPEDALEWLADAGAPGYLEPIAPRESVP